MALGRRKDKVRSSRLSLSASKVSGVQEKKCRQARKQEGGREGKEKEKKMIVLCLLSFTGA